MAFSTVTYTGDGTTTDFPIPFTYIAESHVMAAVDGVETPFTFVSGGATARITPAPANGAKIIISRASSRTQKLVDFENGTVLAETELDQANDQAFFMAQEAIDIAEGKMGPAENATYWDAKGERITNVGTPVDGTDAATKDYADQTVSAAEGYATAAQNSATAASNSAGAAASSALAASNSADAAANSAQSAADSAELAQQMAESITFPITVENGGTGSTSAEDARQALGLEIGVDVEAADADILRADTSDELVAGFTVATHDLGNSGDGTITPSFSDGNAQMLAVTDSFTFAAPSGSGWMTVEVTNNVGSAVITFSGFDFIDGEYDDTNGAVMQFFVDTTGNEKKLYITDALTAA